MSSQWRSHSIAQSSTVSEEQRNVERMMVDSLGPLLFNKLIGPDR